jgi:putative membrane protein
MSSAQRISRGAWVALRGLLLWLLIALIFWAVAAVLPRIAVPSFGAVLLTTALIALLNALLWPLLIRVLLPLTVITFGLGSLVLNAVIVSI